MTSTCDALDWTDNDDIAANCEGWCPMVSNQHGWMIVESRTPFSAKGMHPRDIEKRAEVERRAAEGDELCRKAVAYVTMRRLTS